VVVPLAVGLAAAVLFGWLVGRPSGGLLLLCWWAATLGVSALVVGVVARQLERLLPLVALLRLSLAFPDRLPSRTRLALRAGSVRRLQAQAAELAAHGEVEASEAAETVLVLAAGLNSHDRRTRGHCERVRALSEVIADELRLSPQDHDYLRWASLLHDCGKVMVDAEILNKTTPLSAEEWDVIRRHPQEGARIAAPLRGWLGEWSNAIEQHHERWDGGGYPKGLAGSEITLAARIVSVADAFDAMTSVRSYNTPMSMAAARAEITSKAGVQFDPDVVRAFLMVSTRRLHNVMGPLSWVAMVPFAASGVASAMGTSARRAQAMASAAGGGAAVAAAVGLGVLAPASTSPPAPRVAAARTAPPPAVKFVPSAEVAPEPTPSPPPAPEPATARVAAVRSVAPAPRASAGSPAAAVSTPAPVPATPAPPPSPGPTAPPPKPPAPGPSYLVHVQVQVQQAGLGASVGAVPGVCARVGPLGPSASC